MKEVRMEWTDGLGKAADVWVDGLLLHVCDNVSTRERRCGPGLLGDVCFSYVTDEVEPLDQAVRRTREIKKLIEPVRGWSYVGCGQIVSVLPVIIDFGVLEMPDPRWSTDNDLIGRYVEVRIDRLELRPRGPDDWPDD